MTDTMTKTVPCSAYKEVEGIVYFRRMVDKVRLHQANKLPDEYVEYMGGNEPTTFDGRCCRFLGIEYDVLTAQVQTGLTDDELYAWAIQAGKKPTDRQKEIWNAFMLKRGWRDESTAGLKEQLREQSLPETVQTHFDFFDVDEGRSLRYPEEGASNKTLPKRSLLFPELRSPYETLAGVMHIPRMLDKIRMHQAGKLPEEWVKAKGVSEYFDGLCCEFLCLSYDDIEQRVLQGASDNDILNLINECGTKRSAEEVKIFNTYFAKRGWRDQYTARLHFRLNELGLPPNTVLTMVDFIDLDEGRPVRLNEPLVF